MLLIKDLNINYGKNAILKGIKLRVAEGEIVLIGGRNGSGKTTLLKSIFNLVKITSGEIWFNNKKVINFSTRSLLEKGVIYIPQEKKIFRNLTVRENLEIAGHFMNKIDLERRIEMVLGKFPFLKRKQNDLGEILSGGQQQLLGIARIFLKTPKIILLDEPSSGLSPSLAEDLFEMIKKMAQKNVSIILVEQNFKQASKIADKIYILEEGTIFRKKRSLLG